MATLVPSWPDVVKDLNAGIIAMLVNTVVLLVVSLATGPRGAHVALLSGGIHGAYLDHRANDAKGQSGETA